MAEKFKSFNDAFGPYWPTVFLTNFFFVLLLCVFVWLCWRFGESAREKGLNLLLAIIGALAGWALAMFFAPYSTQEGQLFAEIGKFVSAFLSGYVVSKVDRLLEATMFEEKKPVENTWLRIGLFAGTLTLVLVVVFSNRVYFRADVSPKPSAITEPKQHLAKPTQPDATQTK